MAGDGAGDGGSNLGEPVALPPVVAGMAPTPAPQKKQKAGPQPVDLPHRAKVEEFYNRPAVQYFVAATIVVNFAAIILEKEIDPYPPDVRVHKHVWNAIDDVCNIIFVIELMINLYGSFWRPFLSRGWNYLDSVVVLVGIISLLRIPLEPPFNQIKVLRAFRILRLFKRVKSLNKILVSLVRSIPGVMNAFAVMLIIMCIFAILAVEAFRTFGSDGEYTTVQEFGAYDAKWAPDVTGPEATMSYLRGPMNLTYVDGVAYATAEYETVISSMTPRGFHYGQEYFGTFFRSLYTLFQVLTGESWSEAVVRPLLFGAVPNNAFGVGLFWTVYILLTQVVLQNVVVAVLLDEFTKSGDDDDADDAAGDAAAAADPNAASPAVAGQPAPAAAAPPDAASVAALQNDFARLAAQQAKLKSHLQEILSRLNPNAEQSLAPLAA